MTDWFEEAQIQQLKRHELLPFLDRIYCINNSYLKSNVKSAERIIKKGRENEYIIVGNSVKTDLVFAKNAGIKSAILGKKNTGATYPINDLMAIKQIIK